MRRLKLVLLGFSLAVILALVAFPAALGAAPPPTPLPNGLTAKIVAVSGQTITGSVNAAGYDIGIYIGPGVKNVTVNGATVSGANDEGILVQDASLIVIKNSTIQNNAMTPATHAGENPPALSEDKGIVLAGTKYCMVMRNTVQDNGAGGISLVDDGPRHPFALNTVAATPIAAVGNIITGNTVQRNANSCGIVVAAKNSGPGVHDNVISNNTVTGGFIPGPPPLAYVGAIVLGAGGGSSYANTSNTLVMWNTVTGSLLPGIVMHCFPSGTISNTVIIGNKLSNNGADELPLGPHDSTGIAIVGLPGFGAPSDPAPVLNNTQVLYNSVSGDVENVFVANATNTHVAP